MMVDYGKLVKSLRICINGTTCVGCIKNDGTDDYGCKPLGDIELVLEAADAIEELQAISKKQEIDLVEMTGELASKTKWIPVTERCPEKSGDYLVFDDCRNIYVNEWHCLLKKWQYDDSRITHWMSLPEPPKEETE